MTARVATPENTPVVMPQLAPIIAALLASLTTLWSIRTGSLDLYGDARAHLNIARHVTDGIVPGLAQLGTVWLPLPHVLLAPLVSVDALWHTALAGAIVGGACFVYSALRLFALTEELLGSSRCAWVAFGVYVTNANLLYMQGTALTEPVLLAFFLGTAYHLARWTRTLKHRDLTAAAALTTCATLTRYDGWAVLATSFVIVVVWSKLKERRKSSSEANILIFGMVGGFGIGIWLLYNLIIFGDPLSFIHSSFSAQSQQVALQHVGALATRGSLSTSATTYGRAIVDVGGWALVVLGTAGIVRLMFAKGLPRGRDITVLAVLGTPIVFNVVSLWAGQSTLRVPEMPPFDMWNIRYGLMAVPLLAVGAAALVRDARPPTMRVVLGLLGAGVLVSLVSTPIVVADGRTGTSSATGGHEEKAATYLREHYRGGRILADEASSAPLIFKSGLDLRDFVTIGYHPYYENALASPVTSVDWVVAYDGDAVADDLQARPDLFTSFDVVVHDGRARLLQRIHANT